MHLRLLVALIFSIAPLAPAATTTVQVGQGGGNRFSPSTANIRVGDTVQWTWVASNHSTTSGTPGNPNGIWDSGIHNNGFTFSRVFSTVGTFSYYCRVHGAMMTGSVVVAAATPTPTPTPTATPGPTATPTATPTPTVTPPPTPTPTPTPQPFSSHPLLFPPVATAADVPINIQESCVSILDGPCTYMWTYGGTYPGLMIRRPTGQATHITFTNNLPTLAGSMTVHHHGNHSVSLDDGQATGTAYLFGPGTSRTYTYDGTENGENERGALQWYHDHRMGESGLNVWMGLTGLYVLDDPADPSSLPSGGYEIPLVIADRQFDQDNQLQYFYDPAGVVGDKVLINGVYQPYLNVADRKYRFRILNGANARIYILSLSSGDAFTQIGTESGLLPAPVARSAMQIGPAERLDVVVDFAGKLGQSFYLMDAYKMTPLLKFNVTQHMTDSSTVPTTLRSLPDIGTPTVTRTWSFDQTAGHWSINGQVFDSNRIDARPVLGTTEKWIFTNPTEITHMVHIHDVDQQCISRNGVPCSSYETMKETWAIASGETLELKLKFTDHIGIYMLHCHILEHEDDGMMTLFEVVTPFAPTQAVSRKTHGSAGTFDVNLPLSGNAGIECRNGGANGSYTIVFTFPDAVTSVGGAGVTAGIGTVASSQIDTVDARNYIVNLTGVTNLETVTVTLNDVQGPPSHFSSTLSASMSVLIGDTSYDGIVNASDVAQTKSRIGQAVTPSNFRSDFNANGAINSSDTSIARSNSGTARQ